MAASPAGQSHIQVLTNTLWPRVYFAGSFAEDSPLTMRYRLVAGYPEPGPGPALRHQARPFSGGGVNLASKSQVCGNQTAGNTQAVRPNQIYRRTGLQLFLPVWNLVECGHEPIRRYGFHEEIMRACCLHRIEVELLWPQHSGIPGHVSGNEFLQRLRISRMVRGKRCQHLS